MPELPEVETIVRGLQERIQGKKIQRAELFRKDILKDPKIRTVDFSAFFVGRRFRSIERVGKFILFHLDNGNRLLAHLGMTGKFVLSENHLPDPAHLCSRYHFEGGHRLDHMDIRRFGKLYLVPKNRKIRQLLNLGIDPLSAEFSGHYIYSRLLGKNKKPKTQPIHSLLLNQKIIAGIGNIYASEALFRARIRPDKPSGTLTKKDCQRLRDAIREVLECAISSGGTSISDYRRVDDKPGTFQELLNVYGRLHESCHNCGFTIERIRIGGRSAFFCPQCQPDRSL